MQEIDKAYKRHQKCRQKLLIVVLRVLRSEAYFKETFLYS